MEELNRTKLFIIFMMFFLYGYSTPMDTIKRQNCLNGLIFQINGKTRCIDTAFLYYPLPKPDNCKWTLFLERFYKYRLNMVSVNLQILEESKWYNEDTEKERLRIFYIEYPPDFNSIVLYSFSEKEQNYIKLVKKEMPLFYPDNCFMPDSNYFREGNFLILPEIDYVFPDSNSCFINREENYSMNFKQTEFIIHKRKMQKLIKQLGKLKKSETSDDHFFGPSIVIEYSFKGKYYLLIAGETELWCSCMENSNCSTKKSGLKIEKLLKKY